jgi:hypothetical protein
MQERLVAVGLLAQRALLPEPDVAISGCRFSSIFLPSSAVSGDVFNHFRIGEGRVGFFGADVSGHGVRAALAAVALGAPDYFVCNFAALGGLSAGDFDAALAEPGLRGYGDTPSYQLSAGQLRRVALARLYLSTAPLWILDEPFAAIDQRGVAQLEQLFEQHARRGGAVILTSHQDLALHQVRRIDLETFQSADDVVYEEVAYE